MKKMMLIGILAGISLFTACKKDKSDAPSSGFTAQVDGQAYTATSVSVISTPPDPSVNDHLILSISAVDKNAHILSVVVTFPDDKIHTGTFEINDHNSIVFGSGSTAYSSVFNNQATGSIAISKINDHLVQGTFNGVVVNGNDPSDSKTISNGRFNVKY